MKRKLLHSLVAFALLLAPHGAARAQETEAATLTHDERREAGEFLLRLDESWREARDFSALFDEIFVRDYDEISRTEFVAIPFAFLDDALRQDLSAAERRRSNIAGLNFIYVSGRLNLAFAQSEKNRKAAERAAAAARPSAAGGEPRPEVEEEEDDEPSLEQLLSPAVVEELRRSPLLAGAVFGEKDGGGQEEDGEDFQITSHQQLDDLLTSLERVTPKMRSRVRELEAGLSDVPLSVVARADEGEGESPDLELETLEDGRMNRPAGTRVICGYVSILQVCLVKEGGRYKVLAAYMAAD